MEIITTNFPVIIKFFFYILIYFFFCRFSYSLISYLLNLKDEALKESISLKSRFETEYNKNVKKPYSEYNKKNQQLNPQRTYYKIWSFISVLLVCFNSFILAEFLNNIGNLSKGLILDPIRLNYSHLIAAVIVIVELFTGAGYYIFHKNQLEKPDETVWTVLKWLSVVSFLCLLFVETVMWANLSINFEMSEKLLLSRGNVFRTAIDYFLAALGIGITFFEFFVGYLTSYYKGFSGDSQFFQLGRNIIYSIGLISLLFLPSIALLVIHGLIAIMLEVIKITTMPGNYIYENIFKIKA